MLNSNAQNKATEERGNLLFYFYFYDWFGIMNETTDGTGAGMIFFENDFVSLPLFCVIKDIIYGKGESSMLYIWSYLKKVSQVASPESIFSGPVCYCQFGLANDSSSHD